MWFHGGCVDFNGDYIALKGRELVLRLYACRVFKGVI